MVLRNKLERNNQLATDQKKDDSYFQSVQDPQLNSYKKIGDKCTLKTSNKIMLDSLPFSVGSSIFDKIVKTDKITITWWHFLWIFQMVQQ